MADLLPLPAYRGRATKRRNGGSRNSNRKRLQRWTSSEHAQLEQLVLQYGTEKNWTTIAEGMPGRTGEMKRSCCCCAHHPTEWRVASWHSCMHAHALSVSHPT